MIKYQIQNKYEFGIAQIVHDMNDRIELKRVLSVYQCLAEQITKPKVPMGNEWPPIYWCTYIIHVRNTMQISIRL